MFQCFADLFHVDFIQYFINNADSFLRLDHNIDFRIVLSGVSNIHVGLLSI